MLFYMWVQPFSSSNSLKSLLLLLSYGTRISSKKRGFYVSRTSLFSQVRTTGWSFLGSLETEKELRYLREREHPRKFLFSIRTCSLGERNHQRFVRKIQFYSLPGSFLISREIFLPSNGLYLFRHSARKMRCQSEILHEESLKNTSSFLIEIQTDLILVRTQMLYNQFRMKHTTSHFFYSLCSFGDRSSSKLFFSSV